MQQAHRVRRYFLQEDFASQDESFQKAPEYLERLRAENASDNFYNGVVTDLLVDNKLYFQQVFVSSQTARSAFAFGMLFGTLDQTYIKTRFYQTLLLAVSRDGTNELNFLAVIFFE